VYLDKWSVQCWQYHYRVLGLMAESRGSRVVAADVNKHCRIVTPLLGYTTQVCLGHVSQYTCRYPGRCVFYLCIYNEIHPLLDQTTWVSTTVVVNSYFWSETHSSWQWNNWARHAQLKFPGKATVMFSWTQPIGRSGVCCPGMCPAWKHKTSGPVKHPAMLQLMSKDYSDTNIHRCL